MEWEWERCWTSVFSLGGISGTPGSCVFGSVPLSAYISPQQLFCMRIIVTTSCTWPHAMLFLCIEENSKLLISSADSHGLSLTLNVDSYKLGGGRWPLPNELRIQLVLQFGVDVSAPWTVQLPYNLVLTLLLSMPVICRAVWIPALCLSGVLVFSLKLYLWQWQAAKIRSTYVENPLFFNDWIIKINTFSFLFMVEAFPIKPSSTFWFLKSEPYSSDYNLSTALKRWI